MQVSNYLTIDVEDYYQVSAFESLVPKSSWGNHPSRVVHNTRKILELLEQNHVKATFFTLGWVAEKHPELVRQIADTGHEIGCHSYAHRLVYTLSPEQFRDDTAKAKALLEDVSGKPVFGYRAPSYSITGNSLWALPILHQLGFSYDSSVFPIHHDRYGIPHAPRYPFTWDLAGETPRIMPEKVTQGGGEQTSTAGPRLREYPISTLRIFGKNLPVSGGGYFRLFPYWFTRMALQRINKQERRKFIFYLHPWEIDPDQPRFDQASAFSRFRHYNNLDKTAERFTSLLNDFSFGPMTPTNGKEGQ